MPASPNRRAQLSVVACLVLLGLGSAIGTAPARAGTAYVDGISDQSLGSWAGTFTDGTSSNSSFPGFLAGAWFARPASHIRLARYVVPWDVIADPSDARLDYARFEAWYQEVTSLGLQVDVALELGTAGRYGSLELGEAPSSSAEYLEYLRALLQTFPAIRYLEAWNEPNDEGIAAIIAAHFWSAANALCDTAPNHCTVIAGDLLDTGAFVSYEREYRQGLPRGVDPGNWAIHPYYAVNHYADRGLPYPAAGATSVDEFRDALPKPATDSLWFTEVGAYYCEVADAGSGEPGSVYGTRVQETAASYLVNTLIPDTHPLHVFYYEFAYGYDMPTPCARPDEHGHSYSDTAIYAPRSPGVAESPRPAAGLIYGPGSPLAASLPSIALSALRPGELAGWLLTGF